MAKKLFAAIFILTLILSTASLSVASANGENEALVQVEAKQLDKEAEILAQYLSKYDSPLQYHAQDFVDAAKTYNLDWKLVPAIAGVESTFGKFIPGGYNAWGWGVYGNQAIFFNSWSEAIFTISKGLRENYIDKGYADPFSMNKIYAASPSWGSRVAYFMQDLEKFASSLPQQLDARNLAEIKPDDKIAAISASLVSQSGPVVR